LGGGDLQRGQPAQHGNQDRVMEILRLQGSVEQFDAWHA
jgi:hypothetical protein